MRMLRGLRLSCNNRGFYHGDDLTEENKEDLPFGALAFQMLDPRQCGPV